MSTACLTATESGYFAFDQDVHVSPIPQGVDASDLSVSYEVNSLDLREELLTVLKEKHVSSYNSREG